MEAKYICQGPPVRPGARERKGCGHDKTAAILRIPLDGEEHKVVCPKCESVTLVRRTPPEA